MRILVEHIIINHRETTKLVCNNGELEMKHKNYSISCCSRLFWLCSSTGPILFSPLAHSHLGPPQTILLITFVTVSVYIRNHLFYRSDSHHYLSTAIFHGDRLAYSCIMAATGKLIELDVEPRTEIELSRYWRDLVKECNQIKGYNENQKKSLRIMNAPSKNVAGISGTLVNPAIKDNLKFASMYNDLIHSGKYTEKLIKMEYSYKPAVEDMFKTRDISLEELQSRSSREIETAISQLGHSHTEATISCLSSRHCQDMEILLNNWNMSIEALKDAQLEDFREKLHDLHDNLKSENDESFSESDSLNNNPFADRPGRTISITSNESASTSVSVEDLTLESSDAAIQMEESFTINLGSQLKTAHNLRILAVDSLYLCDPRRNPSCQMRTQTAMSLYSHNLSALVLLVGNHFESYFGIQHEFAQLCTSLNEFHFDSFGRQIKHIQDRVMPSYAGRRNLELGDCYVTRHSNLANVHVVFHLVTDDSLKTNEVNSRHQIMSSLRNILRVAHMYDIKTISIPLLLVDEMDEEILTVAWCLKRAEIVLKCVKGFLIEMASLSTGVEQGTIQFLVPKGISEELFASLASLIPEIFRLANSLVLRKTP